MTRVLLWLILMHKKSYFIIEKNCAFISIKVANVVSWERMVMKKALRIVLKPAVFALFAIVCSFFFTNEVKAGDLLINCDGGVRSVSRDPEKDLVDTVYLVFYNKKIYRFGGRVLFTEL